MSSSVSVRARVAIALALAAAGALAQSPPQAAAAAATAPISQVRRPVLQDYQPFHEQQVTDWQQANRTVGQIGGWRAYAREAQQPPQAGTDPARSGAGAHQGHGGPAR